VAVENLDSATSLFIVVNFHEAESSRLAGLAILHKRYVRHRCARLLEPILYVCVGGLKR